MSKVAWIYPGQGSQYAGMGKDLYEKNQSARILLDELDSYHEGTLKMCFEGTSEELSQTKNTQPCIHAINLAATAALTGYGFKPDVSAGFSLGEYAALTTAKALEHATGFKLVVQRGLLMQEAGEQSNSSMMALIGISEDQYGIIQELSKEVYVVNYNCPGQVVVAGEKGELKALRKQLKELGIKAVPLKVSGAFHSPLMQKASDYFSNLLSKVPFRKPELPVYANATAEPYDDEDLKTLQCQMISPVYWQKTIQNMIDDGVDTFVELGAGSTLNNMIKRIDPSVTTHQVENFDTLMDTVRRLAYDD